MELIAYLRTQDILQYTCLLDIATAFPSTPHTAISEAMRALGTPPHLQALVDYIYAPVHTAMAISWIPWKTIQGNQGRLPPLPFDICPCV